MKKKILLSILLIITCLFYVKVEAVGPPTLYITNNEHQENEVVEDTDEDEEITLRTGEETNFHVYEYIYHDMPTDTNFGKNTISSIPEASKIKWSIDRKNIATIDQNGKLKALKTGTVTVSGCIDNSTYSNIDFKCVSKDVVLELNASCGPSIAYKYVIKYNTDGGDKIDNTEMCPNCNNLPSVVEANDDSTTSTVLPTPKKNGYTFDGWYADSDFKTKITDLDKEYMKINYDDEYDDNYCPLYTYSGSLYAKWISNNETVPIPNTAFDSSKLIIIVGLFLTFIGTTIILNTYKEKDYK